MGNPRALVHVGGAADDHRGGARATPRRLPFDARRAGARPARPTSCGRRRSATCARWSSRSGDGGLGRDRARLRPVLACTSSCAQRLVDGRDRVLRGHELRRGGHAQRARRGAARGPRRRVRRHAGDRGRHGPPAATRSTRSSSDEVRLGAEVFAIDQDPDGVTVHYKTEAGRFTGRGDYAICTLPFSVLRTVEVTHGLLRRASSARSGSSTTTPRRRSCSRSASASGRPTTASSAARRSPTCRSGA